MSKKLALQTIIQVTNRCIGYTPKTPTDFNELGIAIKKKTGLTISLSSLKRLWGYVDYKSFPSPNTLNILARFNDFDDWEDFLKCNDFIHDTQTSDFLKGSVIDAESLNIGDTININWEQDKSCNIVYLGDHQFRIVSSKNIKLLSGDIFTMHSACVGLPFFAAEIHRGNDIIPGYVGAKNNGISSIMLNVQV